MTSIFTKRKGLTLVELMGVVIIVGILASAASVTVLGVRRANAKQLALNRLEMTAMAIRTYYAEKLKWPATLAELTNPGSNGLPYLTQVPLDPYTESSSSPQAILWSSSNTRLWVRGPNGADNSGQGDDIAICVNRKTPPSCQ